MTPPVWAVVPVKPFRSAKTRLSTTLGPEDRAHLARVMLGDVLRTLFTCQRVLRGVIVLTMDDEVAVIGRRYGASILAEHAPSGLNAAVVQAMDVLATTPEAGMLVVPADVPHVSAGVIERMVHLLYAPRALALVRATSDGGTNLLGCRPTGVIHPSFGRESFDAHWCAALCAGILPSVLASSTLGLDLDGPDDLTTFLSWRTNTDTHAFLSSLQYAGLKP
jgi:2-phospho-L-lactate guanylyltransferase